MIGVFIFCTLARFLILYYTALYEQSRVGVGVHDQGIICLRSFADPMFRLHRFHIGRRRPLIPLRLHSCSTQIIFSSKVEWLLIDNLSDKGLGALNPNSGLSEATIIIRIIIIYVDNTADNPNLQKTTSFDIPVDREDWSDACGYNGDTDCVVFENDDIKMFAPPAPGQPGVLSANEVTAFTAPGTDIRVISSSCDVRCDNGQDCSPVEGTVVSNGDLDFDGSGLPFGIPTQSSFFNGFCLGSTFDDPHVTGLRGQRFDWSGEDGGWYAFLSTEEVHMNLRVTSYLPTTFPDRQLITGVALVTTSGHSTTIEVASPLDLSPLCTGDEQPCLANGALRVTMDDQEVMQQPGDFHFDGEMAITAMNLPLECQRFGDHQMWVDMPEDEKLTHAGSRKLYTGTTSIVDWLLLDSVMIAPPWCEKYLGDLDGDVSRLAQITSKHAVFRVQSPHLFLRVNVGINSEREQTLPDGRVVPDASFWQMDVIVEHATGLSTAKGMLGETARLVMDESGKPVMGGLGVLRGEIEDYKVMHPLDTQFKQLLVPEE